MFKITKTINYRIVIFVFIIIISFFLQHYETQAQSSAYGWFASKVEYIDNNLPSHCNPSTDASIEFHLVESGTLNLISNPIGLWAVNVRSTSGNARVGGQYLSGQNQSNRICFNPVNNGLQVVVDNSTNYHPLAAPTINPNFDAENFTSLESMRGNHFRGYVELERKTNTTPTVTGHLPTGGQYFNEMPNFIIETHSLSPLYNTSSLQRIRLYFLRGPNLNTFSVPISGTSGIRSIPGSYINDSISLPDGTYFWTFHQELNGSNLTQKFVSPARQWTFSGIPASGAPDTMSFILDTTPPTSAVSGTRIENYNETLNTATFNFNNVITDNIRLDSTEVWVRRKSNPSEVYYSSRTSLTGTSRTESFSFPSLTIGETYEIYARTIDRAGNVTDSIIYEYEIPVNYNPFNVALRNGEGGYVNGITNLSINSVSLGATILDYGTNRLTIHGLPQICLSTSISDLEPVNIASATCYNRTAASASGNELRYYSDVNSLMSSTTYYFRARVQNAAGWAYSTIGNFTTQISPFDWGLESQTVPNVEYVTSELSNNISASDRLNPAIRFISAGGSEIVRYGICLFTNENDRNNFDPSDVNNVINKGSDCKDWGPLSTNTPVPTPNNHLLLTNVNSVKYRHLFDGLSPSTSYYFRVYAINSTGIGIDDGEELTFELRFEFRNMSNPQSSPFYNSSALGTFDPTTETYNSISIGVAAFDYSSFFVTPNRFINYTLEFRIGSNPPETRAGTIEARIPGQTAMIDYQVFTNIPINTTIKATSTVNWPETIYPQNNNGNNRRTVATNFTLYAPGTSNIIEHISGDDSSSGTELHLDPEFEITANPNYIRSGQSSNIQWSMKNININCTLSGPSTFTSVNINPSTTGTLDPVTDRKSGIIPTGPLSNTQVFQLGCLDLGGNTYSTTTRVTVIGDVIEI